MSHLLWILPVAATLYAFLLWLLAQTSGWARLAYARAAPANEERPHFHARAALRMGTILYGNLVEVELFAEALRLVPSWPARLFHPALKLGREQLHNVSFSAGACRFTVDGVSVSLRRRALVDELRLWLEENETWANPRRLKR